MKKSFLLLPLSLVVLSACTSNSPAPISNADGNLSPGIMQPVNGESAGGSWQPEIQKKHGTRDGRCTNRRANSTAKFPTNLSTASYASSACSTGI